MKTRRLNDIHTFASTTDNETILIGQDERGRKTTIILNTIELLEWIDMDYLKEQSNIYINKL